jgi:DNA-binding LytR/AlgR family response regulator
MNEYTCLIIDDEPPAQRVVELYLKDIPMLKLAGKCPNAFIAMEYLQKYKIDIIFLDINMPKMSGFDFIKTLPSVPAIIVTTAYREYALEGFELDVVDYLKKPFSFERFMKAVNKAIERIRSKACSYPEQLTSLVADNSFIFIKEDKVSYKVDVNKILYIEAFGDYIKVFTPEKIFLTYMSLKKIAEALPASQFIRVHKSYMVSADKIKLIEGNAIKIFDNWIPIGKSYRKDVNDRLRL